MALGLFSVKLLGIVLVPHARGVPGAAVRPTTLRRLSHPRTSYTPGGSANVSRTIPARADPAMRAVISMSVIVPVRAPLIITAFALVSRPLIVAALRPNVQRENVLPLQAQSSYSCGIGLVRQNASMPAVLEKSGAGSVPS